MDQNWNNGANGGNSMPAPNVGMDPNAVPNSGMNTNMQQEPQMAPPNMNMGGSAPVVNQPGVAAPTMPIQQNNSKGSALEVVILVIVCLIAAAAIVAAVIFFLKYNEANENMQAQVDSAVAEAVAEEQERAAKNLTEKLKEPNLEFLGPEDYGSIYFQYPKTWSVYEEKDGSDNSDYMAYFHPKKVLSLGNKNARYALRFAIYNRQYDVVSKQFINDVKNGKLSSQNFSADSGDITGVRYEGQISKEITGTFVVFKVNDKTAILQTDTTSNTELMNDFEAILKTLRRGKR